MGMQVIYLNESTVWRADANFVAGAAVANCSTSITELMCVSPGGITVLSLHSPHYVPKIPFNLMLDCLRRLPSNTRWARVGTYTPASEWQTEAHRSPE